MNDSYKEFVESGRHTHLDKARKYGGRCLRASKAYGECDLTRGYRGLSRFYLAIAQPIPEGV